MSPRANTELVDSIPNLVASPARLAGQAAGIETPDRDVARDFGLVGYVVRGCHVPYDVRRNLRFAAYEWLEVAPVVEAGGDVQARLQVRVREARESATR